MKFFRSFIFLAGTFIVRQSGVLFLVLLRIFRVVCSRSLFQSCTCVEVNKERVSVSFVFKFVSVGLYTIPTEFSLAVILCKYSTCERLEANHVLLPLVVFLRICVQNTVRVDSDKEEQVTKELSKNPYSNQLLYKSTAERHFIKDEKYQRVNKYQKPIGLYLRLLKMFAMPGALVLDATMGTGSLELAAMEPDAPSRLNFLSVEKNSYQQTGATKRLERSCVIPTAPNLYQLDAQEEFHGDEM